MYIHLVTLVKDTSSLTCWIALYGFKASGSFTGFEDITVASDAGIRQRRLEHRRAESWLQRQGQSPPETKSSYNDRGGVSRMSNEPEIRPSRC